jgi:hypothetical protein
LKILYTKEYEFAIAWDLSLPLNRGRPDEEEAQEVDKAEGKQA